MNQQGGSYQGAEQGTPRRRRSAPQGAPENTCPTPETQQGPGISPDAAPLTANPQPAPVENRYSSGNAYHPTASYAPNRPEYTLHNASSGVQNQPAYEPCHERSKEKRTQEAARDTVRRLSGRGLAVMGCGGLALLILVLILVLGGKEPARPATAGEDRTALWTEQPARQQNAVLISRTEQPAVEEINFFHTKAWQDDMLFGYTNEDVYNTTVLNFRGEYLFTLQGDHPFYGVELEREIEAFRGGYAWLLSGEIINTKGETVFSLKESPYDKIQHADWLDAGYILCSTGKQDDIAYYAVNVAGGRSFAFDADFVPGVTVTGGDFWNYLGDGKFFYFVMDYYGDNRLYLYDLVSGEKKAFTYLDEYGVYQGERVPDIFSSWEGMSERLDLKPGESVWRTFGYQLGDRNYYFEVDMERLQLRKIKAGVAVGEEYVSSAKNANEPMVVRMTIALPGPGYQTEDRLFDVRNQAVTPLGKYEEFILLQQLPNGDYCAWIHDENNQSYLSCIDQQGRDRFAPIPISFVKDYDENYVLIGRGTENDVYDWNGQLMMTFEGSSECWLGREGGVYFNTRNEAVYCHFATGETIPMEQLAGDYLVVGGFGYGYHAGYFIGDSYLMDENRQITLLQVEHP
ncbi:MAG: hypothetical protein E7324_06900 [Clostridiales bacterium]|nr:hypothetical protein [Clostridiales bacterium]